MASQDFAATLAKPPRSATDPIAKRLQMTPTMHFAASCAKIGSHVRNRVVANRLGVASQVSIALKHVFRVHARNPDVTSHRGMAKKVSLALKHVFRVHARNPDVASQCGTASRVRFAHKRVQVHARSRIAANHRGTASQISIARKSVPRVHARGLDVASHRGMAKKGSLARRSAQGAISAPGNLATFQLGIISQAVSAACCASRGRFAQGA